MTLQTEFEFTLPRGYVDNEGNLHKQGTMRLATAMDEIAPLRDPRVAANQPYLAIILLARVITRLGSLADVNTGVIEKLFSADFKPYDVAPDGQRFLLVRNAGELEKPNLAVVQNWFAEFSTDR